MGKKPAVSTAVLVKRTPPNRRMGPKTSATRDAMLDAVERIVREEGYPALSARRVAELVGARHQLVYYYFETMDELVLGAFRRRADRAYARLEDAIASEQPLHALWAMHNDPVNAKFFVEFNALALRNEALRLEVLAYIERSRALQEAVLAQTLKQNGVDPAVCPPIVAAMLISGLSQLNIRELALGVSQGAAEMSAFLSWCLQRLEPGSHPT